MKSIVIDRRSWHWKLLSFFDFSSRFADDLCAYTRGVLGALCIALVLVAAAIFYAASMADLLAWLLACLVGLSWVEPNGKFALAAASILLAAIVGIAFGLVYSWIGITKGTRSYIESLPEERRATLSDWWGSIREKVCFRIEYRRD